MSILKQIKNQEELQPISREESKHFSEGRSEGAPYLFYNKEEFCDLMGHAVTYYETGVLLTLKDINKDYPDISRSFEFYNNNKEQVLKIHNRNKYIFNQETRTGRYLRPIKDIEVKVFKDYLYVKETMLETQEVEEYFIDVHTCERLYYLTDKQQFSLDI